jgi:RHS repeat-associated protein
VDAPQPQYAFDTGNHINSSDSNVHYDVLGNVTNDGFHSYTWDAENRLVSADGAAYVYDAFGRRVKGPSYAYSFDLSGQPVVILNAATGAATYQEIYAGGCHLATYYNGATYFHHSDWLGTERVRTGVSGAVAETCTNLPFGDQQACNGADSSGMHFTGLEHDSESNLEHTLFRQLSTTQGRWLTPDPAGMAAADLTNPQSLNQYTYVINDPMDRVDPLGLRLLHKCGQSDRATPTRTPRSSQHDSKSRGD